MKKNLSLKKDRGLDLEHIKVAIEILFRILSLILFSYLCSIGGFWGFMYLFISFGVMIGMITNEESKDNSLSCWFSTFSPIFITVGVLLIFYVLTVLKFGECIKRGYLRYRNI